MGADTLTPAMARDEAVELLARSPLHAAIGLELDAWEHGRASFRLAGPPLVRDAETGILHGGALMAALDTAACLALVSVLGHDCSTVDLHADFLRPGSGDALTVEARVVRAGRRFGWAEAVVRGGDDREVARARGVFAW